jgi:hypothetical protein
LPQRGAFPPVAANRFRQLRSWDMMGRFFNSGEE